MSKIARNLIGKLIIDRLTVAITCLESISDEVKSFRLDEAIRLLTLELEKQRSCDG